MLTDDSLLQNYFQGGRQEPWFQLIAHRINYLQSGRGATPAITLNLTKTTALTTYVDPHCMLMLLGTETKRAWTTHEDYLYMSKQTLQAIETSIG